MSESIWDILGIAQTADKATIRRAYATLLRAANPEDDPDKFHMLRTAYESAIRQIPTFSPIPSIAIPPVAPSTTPIIAPEAADFIPPDVVAEHWQACQRLQMLVVGEDPSNNLAIRDALKTILASPAFEMAGIRIQTETFLLRLTAHSIPRSDALVHPIIILLKLSDNDIGKDQKLSQLILQRAKDFQFLSAIRVPGHAHHTAYQALIRTPQKTSFLKWVTRPLLPSKIRALLSIVHESHPSLMKDFDTATIATWNRALAKPSLQPFAVWILFTSLLSSAAFVLAYPHIIASERLFLWPLLAPFGCFLAYCLWIYAYLLPRKILRENLAWKQKAWLQLGWTAAIPVLFLLAAMLPAFWSISIFIWVISAAIAFWAMVTGEFDRRQRNWQLRSIFRDFSLLVWWLSLAIYLPERIYIQISAPLLAGAIANSFGIMRLFEFWFKFARPIKLGFLGLLLVLATAAGILLWLSHDNIVYLPWGASCFAVALLGQQSVIAGLSARTLKTRYIINYVSVYFALTLASGSFNSVFFWALWLLAGTVFTISKAALPLVSQPNARMLKA